MIRAMKASHLLSGLLAAALASSAAAEDGALKVGTGRAHLF